MGPRRAGHGSNGSCDREPPDSERALASRTAFEPHVTKGRVRFARTAYDKRQEYRGGVYNHALAQITGFRVFDKKAAKRADDLADAFVYAVLRCLGDGRARRWEKIKKAG